MVSPYVTMENKAATKPVELLEVSLKLRDALKMLSEAAEYAAELQRCRWDFAVELTDLRQAGLSRSDCRWLVCKGLVEHAIEVTGNQSMSRDFRPESELVFCEESCFVLTDFGWQTVEFILARSSSPQLISVPSTIQIPAVTSVAADAVLRPHFRNDVRELKLGTHLVKRFRLPSPNQETILRAFEEDEWPARIDDPLPPSPTQNSPHRLRETIKSLNRHQVNRLIHFSAAGDGQGVLWSAQSLRADEAVTDA